MLKFIGNAAWVSRALACLAAIGCGDQDTQLSSGAGAPAGGAIATGGNASGGGAGLQGGATAVGGAVSGSGGAGTGGIGGSLDTATSWTIISPGDVVRATIELADKGGTADYPAGKTRLYYTVQAGGPSAYAQVIEDSPLGIVRADESFADGLVLEMAGPVTVIDETYAMLSGKKSQPRNHANERILSFHAASGKKLDLVVRAYDDGIAFRYRFPEQSDTAHTVTEELTGFRIPEGATGWMQPYDPAGTYTPAYENYWQHEVPVGAASPTTPGWYFPALFKTDSSHYVLLTDTDVDGSYFAAHLDATATDRVYRLVMPEADEANGQGEVNPSSTLPWQTPWRVVIAGAGLGPIVESTLATDLAAPSAIADTSWIEPGRVSWSWWSDDDNPTNYAANVAFVDLAADMGWEYSLVDAGWHVMGNGGNWQDLLDYADSQGVGLTLWYNSGGSHSSVGLAPRDRMHDAETRRSEFQAISSAGIKGIKVDFFHSDKPWMMQYYLDILADAAEYGLLVDFHGCTLQRGWQRTYPNLMTAEAVRGAEWYKYDANYAADQPRRNTILPFTRNVVGSMDYTPVTFTDHAYAHFTTNAHELALSVVFESGLQHFADQVSGYTSLPAAPLEFLKDVPVTWDDVRFLDGSPGSWIVLARKKGDAWYVGGIGGDDQPHDFSIPLSFLDSGDYTASVITDGADDDSFADSTTNVTSADSLSVSIRAQGGFVARLTP